MKRKILHVAFSFFVLYVFSLFALSLIDLDRLDTLTKNMFNFLFVPIAVSCGVMAWTFLSVSRKKMSNPLYVILSFAFTLFFMAEAFTLHSIIKSEARSEIRNLVGKMDIDEVCITVNGKDVTQKQEIINGLKELDHIGSRWNPTDKTRCVITCHDEKVVLVIARDIYRKSTCWVYYPKYSTTKNHVIGGFLSKELDLEK